MVHGAACYSISCPFPSYVPSSLFVQVSASTSASMSYQFLYSHQRIKSHMCSHQPQLLLRDSLDIIDDDKDYYDNDNIIIVGNKNTG